VVLGVALQRTLADQGVDRLSVPWVLLLTVTLLSAGVGVLAAADRRVRRRRLGAGQHGRIRQRPARGGVEHREGREAYDDVFDAILLLHRGQPRDVLAMLGKPHERTGFHARLFAQWRIALQAEAAVLAGDAGARQQVRTASRAAVGHPVAELIVRRAATLIADDRQSLVALGDAFDHIDCPYQRARTLTLAGGAEEGPGRSLMTSLG
jgi:hypothetical protein